MMSTIRFLGRDIRLGIIRRAYLMIIAVIFSFVMVQQCATVIEDLQEMNFIWSNGTIMDYYIFSAMGMRYYRFDSKSYFQIPLMWFVFQIGISYFIAYYSKQDYLDGAVNVLVAGKSRSVWWRSKYIWCVLSVLAYYMVTFLSCSVFSAAQGAGISLNISRDFMEAYFGYGTAYISDWDFIVMVFIVPIMTTLGICSIQHLMSLVFSPVTSFAVTSIFYILSAYYTVWFLPGSFTMWFRSTYYDAQGVNPLSGIILSLFILFAVYVLGHMYITQKDIID